MLLKFYADESYNGKAFSFGGWLAEERTWNRIESQWRMRIQYEQRKHGKFDRYHASDCANRKRDYDNWTNTEQIQHVRKLLSIITRRHMDIVGICSGINLSALKETFDGERDPLVGAYNLAVRRLMILIHRALKKDAGHRVAIIHDRTQGYDGVIVDAFNTMLNDPSVPHYKKLFTTIAPMGWEDCIPLQPADLIAYEGFKAISGDLNSTARMRKSMEKLVGGGVRVMVRYLGKDSLSELGQAVQARKAQEAMNSEVNYPSV